jgi:hypothetical protein
MKTEIHSKRNSELSPLALLAVVEQEFLWNSVETTKNNAVADFDRLNQRMKCVKG